MASLAPAAFVQLFPSPGHVSLMNESRDEVESAQQARPLRRPGCSQTFRAGLSHSLWEANIPGRHLRESQLCPVPDKLHWVGLAHQMNTQMPNSPGEGGESG